jgi:hypothetical protein
MQVKGARRSRSGGTVVGYELVHMSWTCPRRIHTDVIGSRETER